MFQWEWHSLLACAAAVYATVVLFRGLDRPRSVARIMLLVSLAAVATGYAMRAAGSVMEVPAASALYMGVKYAWVVSASFLLASLANMLRDDKPPFARYPVAFTLLPLVLIPFYPFISHTLLIQDWVLGLYHVGSLLMSLFLFALIARRDRAWRPLLALWPLFAGAWALHWTAGAAMVWLVPVMLAGGMILAAIALTKIQTDVPRLNSEPIS